FLTWRQAPLSERNLIKTKCRIKNQHFVNNLGRGKPLLYFPSLLTHGKAISKQILFSPESENVR
ncbi:hypothetical protein, partial [Photorhabdus temperata]|uniref:hypothetical protein n=1 Tax=Photorhabdus temperata TaxID=574560 RepID=UPI001E471CDB